MKSLANPDESLIVYRSLAPGGLNHYRYLVRFFRGLIIILAFLLAATSVDVGAAGPEEFQPVRPGRAFQFPRDHGAHPEFKTEWWYWVGHLQSGAGETFGYQLTFFRAALRKPDPKARSAWSLNTIYFAHLALTDPQRRTFTFRERVGRGALGLAGAQTGTLKVWVDSWQADLQGGDVHLSAPGEGLGLDLTLHPLKPPALHGEKGFSRKGAAADAASYYYSLSRLDTKGQLTLDGQTVAVAGESWMDHEFFTGSLAPGQVGWDWFALQLSDGAEVMLYLLRGADGAPDPASSGTLIEPGGRTQPLKLSDFQVKPAGVWKSPHSQAVYPAGWEVSIPGAGYRLRLTPTLADQELRAEAPARLTYWEGQVKIQGAKNGQALTGQGYVELTGYAGGLGEWPIK
jgi:predicted secreted hydrolase